MALCTSFFEHNVFSNRWMRFVEQLNPNHIWKWKIELRSTRRTWIVRFILAGSTKSAPYVTMCQSGNQHFGHLVLHEDLLLCRMSAQDYCTFIRWQGGIEIECQSKYPTKPIGIAFAIGNVK